MSEYEKIKEKRKKKNNQIRIEAIKLYQQGLSLREVAVRIGKSYEWVRQIKKIEIKKEENVKYKGIHMWLNRNFGKANKCENPECKNISKKFEWAKLKNKEYIKKRDNFWMLCKKCHTQYDLELLIGRPIKNHFEFSTVSELDK